MNTTAEYFARRLDGVEAFVETWDTPWSSAKEDVEGLLEEVLVWARDRIDFNGISGRLEARTTLDFPSLKQMHSQLARVQLPGGVDLGPMNVTPTAEVTELETGIVTLEETFEEKNETQVGAALSLRIGANVNRLLYAAAACTTPIPDLLRLVRSKLDLLAQVQVAVLWSAVQRELDPEAITPLIDYEGSLEPGWLKYEDVEKTKDKLAEYAVELKPRLLVAAAKRGRTSVPLQVPDVVQIVAWKSSSAAERVSEQEMALGKSVLRLASLIKTLFGRDESDLAMGLGLLPQSRLLKPERASLGQPKDKAPALRSICYEIRKFVQLVEFLMTRHSPLQTLLHQFKLGLEVMAPDICGEYARKSELQLQRELVRFLIEHGIYAVGTKFGSYETDLVVGEHADHYVVEVKRFRRGDSITVSVLRAAFVQLQSYMDEPPTHPLGVLLVFNFSDSLLIAPRIWIRSRYWILVLNLQARPPSGRTKSITVEEGREQETIRMHVIDAGRMAATRKANRSSGSRPTKAGRSR